MAPEKSSRLYSAELVEKRVVNVLAPSFGKLDWDYLRESDTTLCTMFEETMNKLERAREPRQELRWPRIASILEDSRFLEVDEESEQARHINRSFMRRTSWWPRKTLSEDKSVSSEVEQWFKDLIDNGDVHSATTISLDEVKSVVSRVGLEVKGPLPFIRRFFIKNQERTKTLIDVGALRFPDAKHPYFRVYRIQITAWATCHRGLFRDENVNGMNGDYHTVKYRPREDIFKYTSML